MADKVILNISATKSLGELLLSFIRKYKPLPNEIMISRSKKTTMVFKYIIFPVGTFALV